MDHRRRWGMFRMAAIGLISLFAAWQVSREHSPKATPSPTETQPAARRTVVRRAPATALVNGVVRTHEGAPVAGARVVLARKESNDIEEAAADAAGRFALHLPAGEYLARAAGEEVVSSAAVRVVLAPGDAQHLDLEVSQGVVLRGTVADAAGGVIVGAVVTALGHPFSATTDDAGHYSLCLPVGDHILTASAEGYAPRHASVARGGRTHRVDFSLVPAASLRGRVVSGGVAVAGAAVSLQRSDGWPFVDPTETTSDGQGVFEFPTLSVGLYQVTGRRGSEFGRTGPIATSLGSQAEVILELRPGSAVFGVVVKEGRPVTGATVSIALDELPRGVETSSGADGRWRIEGLPRGTHQLTASHPDLASLHREVQVTAAEIGPIELALAGGGELAGHVVDRNGRPVAGAAVRVSTMEEPNAWIVRSDLAGAFRVRHVVGPLQVSAEDDAAGYAFAEVAEVHGGQDLRLTLEASGRLSGRVVSARTSQPMAGAYVFANRLEGDFARQMQTDAEGRFAFAWLAPGVYVLRTSRTPDCSMEAGQLSLTVGSTGQREVTLTLPEGGHRLRGIVLDEQGQPVARASVTTVRGGTAEAAAAAVLGGGYDAYTRDDGRFGFDDVPEGQYVARVLYEGYAESTADLRMDQETAVRLRRGASIDGTCVAEEGAAAVGDVAVRLESPLTMRRNAYGMGGRFRFDGIPPGSYHVVVVTADGERTGTAEVTLESGVLPVRIPLASAVQVYGRVVDAETSAPVAAFLALAPDGAAVGASSYSTSGRDGTFRIGPLVGGRLAWLSIYALGQGYGPEFRGITIPAGGRLDAGDIPLRKAERN